MKICIFGNKNTTIYLCNFFERKQLNYTLITLENTHEDIGKIAGYVDLKQTTKANKVYHPKKYNLKDDLNFFNSEKFDLGFVMGWQRLIPDEVLKAFKSGVFGMHGSTMDLPRGRGRSPMNWAIIERRKWFTTNLFKYLPGVDDGPILDKRTFSIQHNDTSESMHYKNTLAMIDLLEDNIEALLSGDFETVAQDNSYAPTYYPKRDPDDSLINFEYDIFHIDSFIKAVTKPFNGAFCNVNNKNKITIFSANIFYTNIENHPFKENRIGEVCYVFENGKFLLKVEGGVLIVNDYETKCSILEKDIFSSPIIKSFERNSSGNFDIQE